MKTAFKIVGFVLLAIVAMVLVCCLLLLAACDFRPGVIFDPLPVTEQTVDVDLDAVVNVDVTTAFTDVAVRLAGDGKARLVCHEYEGVSHPVTVDGGRLTVRTEDARPWYRRMIGFRSPEMTLYLPEKEYGQLQISLSTGDVTLPGEVRFGDVSVTTGTGDVFTDASVAGRMEIAVTTGKITVDGAGADTLTLTATTGDVSVSKTAVAGDVSVTVSTGRVACADVTCTAFTAKGSTGDLEMTDVVAAGEMCLERSTGDVTLDRCDAAALKIKTSTGDVTGTLRTPKIFYANTSTGRVDVPRSTEGGLCEVETSTGDIRLSVAGQ